MAVDVVMPRLSDSMEEGTILKWLKQPGDAVAVGDELAEIETDKATMSCEADAEGTLLEIVVGEGESAPLGAPIARIGQPGETNGGGRSTSAPASTEVALVSSAASPAAAAAAVDPPAAAAPVAAAGGAPAAAPPAAAGDGRAPRAKASPVARRLARELGVDLAALTGSGPRGRIVKADVHAAVSAGGVAVGAPAAASARGGQAAEGAPAPPAASARGGQAAEGAPAPPAAAPAPNAPAPAPGAGPAGGKGEVTRVELTRLQQTVARRMAEAKSTQPEFVLRTDVDMEEAVALRGRLRELAAAAERPAPSYNDLVVRACALALREHPRANGAYKDGAFELYERVNVGVAVAGEDALLVPVVQDADRKSLGEIARETRALAESARAGSLTAAQLSGGTFTISNLGMFGVTGFTAVLNSPQAAILAVGALEQRAVVRDGQVVARHRMELSLTCDHRILYGADAAAFLARVRELLEQPLSLAL